MPVLNFGAIATAFAHARGGLAFVLLNHTD
jgi:hypothetical protein